MNRIKTFIYYLGTIMLGNILVSILIFSSNKFFDNLIDVLFVPTNGAALGYIPFILASHVALSTTNNYEGTRKILYRWKFFIASFFTFLGLAQLIAGIYFGMPLFEFSEEISFGSIPNHWLHNLPVGITGFIAGFQVKNDKMDFF